MTELAAVTWNLFYRDPQRLRLRQLVDELRPAVLLLQEARGPAVATALPGEYTCHYWGWRGLELGIMIASRLPTIATGSLGSGAPWGQDRVCWARLRTPLGALTAAAVHLTTPYSLRLKRQRDLQRAALNARTAEAVSAGERLLVGGDFNTINPRLPALRDASAGRTRATWRHPLTMWMPPLLRLDALFVSPGITVREAAVRREYRSSDHLPVVVRLTFDRQPSGHLSSLIPNER